MSSSNSELTLRLVATERSLRERDQELRHSRERREHVLASISDAYFALDREGRVCEVNAIAERTIFNRPAAELLGKTAWEDQSPEARAEFPLQCAAAWERDEPAHFETQFPGAWRWFEVHAHRRADWLEVYCRDITDRRLAEAALRESEERFRLAFQQAAVGIGLASPDGTLMAVNPGFCRILGFDAAELVGMRAIDLVPAEDRAEHQTQLGRVLRNETGSYATERRFLRKDGSFIWGNLSVSIARDEGGGVLFGLGVLEDSHARKNLEAQREFLLESERAARSDAERCSRVKDEFVARLSHELRTPLHAITGWAQLLQRNNVKPDVVAEGVKVVLRSARSLSEMIDDLLDMSRIQAGTLRFEVQPVSLPGVVQAAVDSLRSSAELKGVTIDLQIALESSTVVGDPGRLQQVVWNLLSNAIKFTSAGGKVAVRLQQRESAAEIEVADSGRGIAPEFLPHVFGRFRQQDAAIARKHQGLGLGLAIARYIVEAHSGTLKVTSAGEGHGATFTVGLPVSAGAAAEDSETPGAHPPRRRGEELLNGVDLNRARILIVDDEQDARELLRRVLIEHNAEVVVADGAARALALLRESRPELLISDIGMPDLDGYALLRQVRALPADEGGKTAAIALTAFARPKDRLHALEAGFQVHVAKPVDTRELLSAVAKLTRNGTTSH